MEYKSEVHILTHTQIREKLLAFAVLPFLLCSCSNIGFYTMLFGEEDVDERYDGFIEIKDDELPALPSSTAGKYSFVVVTDIHIGANDVKDSKMDDFLDEMEQLFENKNEEKIPRFIINLGDTADGGHASELKKFNSYCKKIQSLAVRKGVVSEADDFMIYSILGNHDLYNNGWDDWEDKVYPYCSTYYFSLSVDSSCLPFSFYFVDTGNGAFGKNQLDDLEDLMKADKNHKMVFSHYPFYSDQTPVMTIEDTTERNYLLDLFERTDVGAMFGGHVHTNFNRNLGDFTQINTAALFKNGYYCLVTVDEASGTVSEKKYKF